MNDIKLRLDEATKILQLLKWHKETIEEALNREAKKLNSKLLDMDGDPDHIVHIKAATIEQLTSRIQYFYYAKELIDIVGEIRAKKKLIVFYKDHYEKSIKAETKAVADSEIWDAITEMNNLPLKGDLKKTANNLSNDFVSGKITGLSNRFEFLEAVKNFIQANS